MLTVWLNRTYATTVHVIDLLRNNPDGEKVRVLASHPDPDSPVLAAGDEAFLEPEYDSVPDYVDWALDFCLAHDVEIFIPRLHMAALSGASARFAKFGVTVLAAPPAAVTLLDDKAATYALAQQLGLRVPPYRVVADSAGLRAAYEQIDDIGSQVCLKPVTGVGGEGFRVLTRAPLSLADVLGPSTQSADLDQVCRALDEAIELGRPVPPLLVMPFLTGPEVSVDLLADQAGTAIVAIGRVKTGRRRVIIDDVQAREMAQALASATGASYLTNTQVRYWRHPEDAEPQPYLLEVNARMSGGLHQTALAGVNLPWAALRIARGFTADLRAPTFDRQYTVLDSVALLR